MGGRQRTTLFHTKESIAKEEAKPSATPSKEKAKKPSKEKSGGK